METTIARHTIRALLELVLLRFSHALNYRRGATTNLRAMSSLWHHMQNQSYDEAMLRIFKSMMIRKVCQRMAQGVSELLPSDFILNRTSPSVAHPEEGRRMGGTLVRLRT
jgi:hypothetical protein